MKLVYEDSGKEVMVGDKSVTFRDDAVEVMYITKPHKPSSTGRVGVRFANELHTVEYYPGVIGATWIEREDQPWLLK